MFDATIAATNITWRFLASTAIPDFSRTSFCSSRQQKRVVEYGEWLLTDVLKKVPQRHRIFGIPKRLKIYFMYDRSLLGKPSTCAWNVMSAFLKSAVPRDGAVPGASIAIQTYGGFLNPNSAPARHRHRRLPSSRRLLRRRPGIPCRRPRGSLPVRSLRRC